MWNAGKGPPQYRWIPVRRSQQASVYLQVLAMSKQDCSQLGTRHTKKLLDEITRKILMYKHASLGRTGGESYRNAWVKIRNPSLRKVRRERDAPVNHYKSSRKTITPAKMVDLCRPVITNRLEKLGLSYRIAWADRPPWKKQSHRIVLPWLTILEPSGKRGMAKSTLLIAN